MLDQYIHVARFNLHHQTTDRHRFLPGKVSIAKLSLKQRDRGKATHAVPQSGNCSIDLGLKARRCQMMTQERKSMTL